MNNEINDFMKNHVYNICSFSERKMQAYILFTQVKIAMLIKNNTADESKSFYDCFMSKEATPYRLYLFHEYNFGDEYRESLINQLGEIIERDEISNIDIIQSILNIEDYNLDKIQKLFDDCKGHERETLYRILEILSAIYMKRYCGLESYPITRTRITVSDLGDLIDKSFSESEYYREYSRIYTLPNSNHIYELMKSIWSIDIDGKPFDANYNVSSFIKQAKESGENDKSILELYYIAKVAKQIKNKRISNLYQYMRKVFTGSTVSSGFTFDESPGTDYYRSDDDINGAIRKWRNIDITTFLENVQFSSLYSDIDVENKMLNVFLKSKENVDKIIFVDANPLFIRDRKDCDNSENEIFIFTSKENAMLYKQAYSDLTVGWIDNDVHVRECVTCGNTHGFIDKKTSTNQEKVEMYIFIRSGSKEKILEYLEKGIDKQANIEAVIMAPNTFVDKKENRAKLLKCMSLSEIDLLPTKSKLFSGPEKRKCIVTLTNTKSINNYRMRRYHFIHDSENLEKNEIKGELLLEPWDIVAPVSDFEEENFSRCFTLIEIFERNILKSSNKKRRSKSKEYIFSPEIHIWYSISNRRGRIGYYTVPSNTNVGGKYLPRGKKIYEKAITARTEDKAVESIKNHLYDDDELIKMIVTDIHKAYLSEPISLKTYWYCNRKKFENKQGYNDLKAISIFESNEISNCMSNSPLESEKIETMIQNKYGEANEKEVEEIWKQLNIIAKNADEDSKFCPETVSNHFEQIYEFRRRKQQARSALTRKSYTLEQEKKILSYILKNQKDPAYVGAAIGFYTGMSNREIVALNWGDVHAMLNLEQYQFYVYKEMNREGVIDKIDISQGDRYRRIPLVNQLKEIVVENYKKIAQKLVSSIDNKSSESEFEKDPLLIRICDGEVLPLLPNMIRDAKKKSESAAGIRTMGDKDDFDIDEYETDFDKYPGNRFRTNIEYRMLQTCRMTREESNYILGLRQSDVYAKHYCDYTNDFSQIILQHKMERWTLLNGINNSSNMPLKANVRKSKKVIVSSKKRQIIEIEGELDKEQIISVSAARGADITVNIIGSEQ